MEEDTRKRVIDKVRKQAGEAFEKGYKWLYERVDAGDLDYDDLCTINECEDPTDIVFYFMGDYRDAILRLKKSSPEFFEGVKKAVSEILTAIKTSMGEPGKEIFD